VGVMGAVRRIQTVLAGIGVVASSLVLVASFVPGQPHPSLVAGWVLLGLAALFWVIARMEFMLPMFRGELPFDLQAPFQSKVDGWHMLWRRASGAGRREREHPRCHDLGR
jgi:hypothetical protein